MAILEKEREVADAYVRSSLALDAVQRWENCQSTHQFMGFKRKQLVTCHNLFDKFNKLNTWTCQNFKFDKEHGLSSTWRDENGREIDIGHTPVELAPNCFIWHAAYGRFELYPYGETKRLAHRFGMLTRTLKNPRIVVPGIIYVFEKQTFDELTNKG